MTAAEIPEPIFLDVEDVIALHQRQLLRFGGGDGIRDRTLLESAVAQPQASFGGEYVHGSLIEMAAAYLYHIVSNHPFVDGNKRAGLLSALTFLKINGISIVSGSEELYVLTMEVASGRKDKKGVAESLRRLAHN